MAGLIALTRFLGRDTCAEMMQEDYHHGYGRSSRMLGGVRTCFRGALFVFCRGARSSRFARDKSQELPKYLP